MARMGDGEDGCQKKGGDCAEAVRAAYSLVERESRGLVMDDTIESLSSRAWRCQRGPLGGNISIVCQASGHTGDGENGRWESLWYREGG